MSWEKYDMDNPQQRPRCVQISKPLSQAIQRFTEEKSMTRQQCFDSSLICLWRIWNGNTDKVEPASALTEIRVRNILIDNPQPKDTKNDGKRKYDGKKHYVNIHFKGEKSCNFFQELERLYMIHGFEDGIRRVLSWFLREQGYLNHVDGQKKKQDIENKLDDIDSVT